MVRDSLGYIRFPVLVFDTPTALTNKVYKITPELHKELERLNKKRGAYPALGGPRAYSGESVKVGDQAFEEIQLDHVVGHMRNFHIRYDGDHPILYAYFKPGGPNGKLAADLLESNPSPVEFGIRCHVRPHANNERKDIDLKIMRLINVDLVYNGK